MLKIEPPYNRFIKKSAITYLRYCARRPLIDEIRPADPPPGVRRRDDEEGERPDGRDDAEDLVRAALGAVRDGEGDGAVAVDGDGAEVEDGGRHRKEGGEHPGLGEFKEV